MGDALILRSRRVLLGGELRPARVSVRDGRIEKIGLYEGPDEPGLIDLGSEVLMPGAIDTHAHINEPGRTDWEGFQTATRAAAAGGITTVIDMPLNSIPATTTLDALRVKARTAEGKCAIDYGFWGGVVPGNARELEPMVREGALGFKCFLIESGVDEFPMSREKDLLEAMPILARLGVPLLVHAELDTGHAGDADDASSYWTYLESRPEDWEVQAIRMMIRLAEKTSCRVHIVHLSAASALPDLLEARSRGVPVTAETCPHYLVFEAERIERGRTQYKCAPPIRGHMNREALWRGLREDVIDFIVSDHSPCTPDLKRLESGDFGKAWGGIAGLQFSLPAVWTEMSARGLGLAQLTEWMSARTALFAGLERRKGKIAEGFDADLVAFDPDARFRVELSLVLHRNPVTPYEGMELRGRVTRTFVRGKLVYDRGAFPSGPAFPAGAAGQQVIRSTQERNSK